MSQSIKIPLLKILSFIGLGMTIIPSILVYLGTISHDTHINLMGIGMVAWFVTAPFWINKDSDTKD